MSDKQLAYLFVPLIVGACLIPSALMMLYRQGGWSSFAALKFWSFLAGGLLPWIFAVPAILAVTSALGVNGEGRSAAGIGAILAALAALVVASSYVAYVGPESAGGFTTAFKRSFVAAATLYGLIGVLHAIDVFRAR